MIKKFGKISVYANKNLIYLGDVMTYTVSQVDFINILKETWYNDNWTWVIAFGFLAFLFLV